MLHLKAVAQLINDHEEQLAYAPDLDEGQNGAYLNRKDPIFWSR